MSLYTWAWAPPPLGPSAVAPPRLPLGPALGLGATISRIEEAGPPHTGNVANSEVSLFKSP